MPTRPDLLNIDGLGETEAYFAVRRAFRPACRSGIVDALGRVVEFTFDLPSADRDSCRHICYTPPIDNENPYAPRLTWRPDRAVRSLWVVQALTNPWELRPNPHEGRYARYTYLLHYSAEDGIGPEERYLAVATETHQPGRLAFVTAFPVTPEELWYWKKVRRAGAILHPPSQTKTRSASIK
jgi:hypothetical protein